MAERVHIAYNLVQDLCQEYVFHKHKDIDYEELRRLTKRAICALFEKK